jgi:hypothetical protein
MGMGRDSGHIAHRWDGIVYCHVLIRDFATQRNNGQHVYCSKFPGRDR